MMYARVIAVTVLCLLVDATITVASPTTYNVVDLGMGFAGEPRAINQAGLPVGNVGLSTSGRAVVFDPAGSPTDLPRITDPGDRGGARGVNAGQTIVGWLQDGNGFSVGSGFKLAVRWDGGGPQWLDMPLGGTNSYANAINDSGIIAGQWDKWSRSTAFKSDDVHAARWQSDGTVTDLALPGEVASVAFDINASGQIVGYSRNASSVDEAVIWHPAGGHVNLGVLLGERSQAQAINDAGVVAGYFQRADGSHQPYLYDGQVHQLGLIAGASRYGVHDINSDNDVVGYAVVSGVFVPVLWQDGVAYNLNDLLDDPAGYHPSYVPEGVVVTFSEAFAINDAGVIAISGSTPNPFAATRPFLFVPVPEPASAMLLIGGAGILCRRVRRRDTVTG